MNGAYKFCEIKDCKCMTCKRNNSKLSSSGDCYPCRCCNGGNFVEECKRYVEENYD